MGVLSSRVITPQSQTLFFSLSDSWKPTTLISFIQISPCLHCGMKALKLKWSRHGNCFLGFRTIPRGSTIVPFTPSFLDTLSLCSYGWGIKAPTRAAAQRRPTWKSNRSRWKYSQNVTATKWMIRRHLLFPPRLVVCWSSSALQNWPKMIILYWMKIWCPVAQEVMAILSSCWIPTATRAQTGLRLKEWELLNPARCPLALSTLYSIPAQRASPHRHIKQSPSTRTATGWFPTPGSLLTTAHSRPALARQVCTPTSAMGASSPNPFCPPTPYVPNSS